VGHLVQPPLPKQGHLQQAAQDLVQVGLEYLQRRRLHNLPRQPVPVLRHPQREEEKMGKVQVYGVESIAGKKALLTENGSVKGS